MSMIQAINKNEKEGEGNPIPSLAILGLQDRIKESMQASMKKKMVKPKVKPTKSDKHQLALIQNLTNQLKKDVKQKKSK
tara:strand:+ start:246 stop:482 length:237 start_codon:yes stop_codon:yes gene_type:complete